MPATRRNFLRNAGAGFLSAAGLLLPGKLFAFGRRRGAGGYCPQPVVCPPIVSAPPPRRVTSGTDVSLCFPLPPPPNQTTMVPGLDAGGIFCAWGTCSNGPVTRSWITDAGGNLLIAHPFPPCFSSSTNWAVAYPDCPTGAFYLVFDYDDGTVGGAETSPKGPFQLRNCMARSPS